MARAENPQYGGVKNPMIDCEGRWWRHSQLLTRKSVMQQGIQASCQTAQFQKIHVLQIVGWKAPAGGELDIAL
jgi:hypothetical protein